MRRAPIAAMPANFARAKLGRRPEPYSVRDWSMNRLVRLWRACEASAAIETAFILPVLLLGTLGTVEGARALWTQSSLQSAVVEAARCAAISPGSCTNVPTYAASQISWLGIPANDFSYSSTATCGVTGYAKGSQVAVSYTFQSVVNGLIPPLSHLTLTASACHP
ncbi:MAG TPA: TadE family protein [Rhizomicrobium sp.]|nr:TadE family protein [Rhizomicrobium sp.]